MHADGSSSQESGAGVQSASVGMLVEPEPQSAMLLETLLLTTSCCSWLRSPQPMHVGRCASEGLDCSWPTLDLINEYFEV